MVRALVRIASAAIVAFLGVAQGYRPGDEICSYSSGSSCPLSAIKPSATDGSVLIYPGGKTRCAYDDFKDPATGFTSNATYFFQVFPKPQKKKLALMLQGGGACIDQITCSFSIQCSLPSSLVSTRAQAISTGIFNSNDATNPLKDWNIVHLPYCTGDLHVGNAVLPAYESGLESIFGRPQCLGQKKAMYLNGWENVKAAFTWAKANYPDVDELIIGGMSAGSLGAQALATYAADLWNVQAKGISFGVLADSYVGVLPADKPAGKILKFYGGCNSDLKLPASIVASCNAETTTISEIGQAVLKQLPNAALLFINSMGDGTQRLFYQLVKEGVFGYPFPNLMSEADYFVEVNKIIDLYKAVNKRVSTFFVPGTQHVFLNSNGFAAAVSQAGEQLGNALSSWIQSLGVTTPTTAPTPTTSSPTPTRPAC